jgi:DNA processing protein
MASDLPDEAYAAALAGLPRLRPARLRTLLRRFPPAEAWARLQGGDAAVLPDPSHRRRGGADPTDILRAWSAHARGADVEALWERCASGGVTVHLLGRPGYPPELADDLAAPAVLFSTGRLDILDATRVTVVGTRNATVAGREMATLLAAGLARAGIAVVSGLAKGIDGAAHRGALREGGPVVGVVGSGLDVVYPPDHRALWASVIEHGVLLSEVPPGTAPEAYRFPLRNRILAALAHIVVVVESRTRGGSLHTVEEAQRRGITVCAVPGSPRNAAAGGTNRLITDGATPVLDPTDILVALGLNRPARLPLVDPRPRPDADDLPVLELFDDEPLDLEAVISRSGLGLASAALALARLEAAGWLVRTGGWFERAALAAGRP